MATSNSQQQITVIWLDSEVNHSDENRQTQEKLNDIFSLYEML